MRGLPARSGMATRTPCRVRGVPRRIERAQPPASRPRSPAEPGRPVGGAEQALEPHRALVAMGNRSRAGGNNRTGDLVAAIGRRSRPVSDACRERRRTEERKHSGRRRSDDHRGGAAANIARCGSAHRRRSDSGECLRAGGSRTPARAGDAIIAGRARPGPGRAARASGYAMSRWRTLLSMPLWLCVAAACAPLDRQPDMRVDDSSAQRQVLVMLRVAPPHFRPDVDYAGGYDSRVGRDARRRIAEGLASQYGLKIIDAWPMPALGVDCFVMETQGTSSLARLVEKLSLDPRVESAQSMNLFHVLGYNDPLYSLQPAATSWHLADLHRITTGKNVRVAEIDTGVETAHPDLSGRVALSRNFVDERTEVAEAHGTEVAGIIAAAGNNGIGIVGVAPEARLLVLRACWQTSGSGDPAVCSSFTLAKALQFALSADAQVINLSLGGPRDRLLERLLDTALSRGITVVGAADPGSSDGGFPASHRGVLAIATDDGH